MARTAQRFYVKVAKATMTTGDLASGGSLQPTQGSRQAKISPPTQRFLVRTRRRRKKNASG
jgi:hypothetical protein